MTWADQEKINQFSRLNTRQSDAQFELEQEREEREQLDEVAEELEMLELNEGIDDEDLDGDVEEGDDVEKRHEISSGPIGGRSLPFKIGDAFVYVTLSKAIELLDIEKTAKDARIKEIQDIIADCEKEMKVLKVDLYAKFGSNISKSAFHIKQLV